MLFSRSAESGAVAVAAAETPHHSGAAAVRTDRWWTAAAYGCIAFVAIGGFVVQTGTWFRGPDWAGLTAFHDGPSWQPFDGTLSLTSSTIFGLVASLSEWTFWPYRLVTIAAVTLALVAVFRFTRRIAGAEVGLLATAVLASFTHAAPLLAQPFGMHYPLSVAMAIALAHVLDANGGRAAGADLIAAALFAAALATSVVGLAAIPVVVTALVAQRGAWPRWLLLLAPLAMWVAWMAWRGSLDTEPWTWTSRGQYLANLVGRSFQHLACNSATLAAVAAAGVIAVLWTDPERRLSAAWRPLRWLEAGGVFAIVSTYRGGSIWLRPLGGDPSDTHSWLLAVFVVLAVVESVRGRHRELPETWRQTGLGALCIAIALSSVTLAHALETNRDDAPDGHGLDAEVLAAAESVGGLRDDSWLISIDFAEVPARGYQSVVADFGSPLEYFGVTPDESQQALRSRDRIVMEGLGIAAGTGDCQWTSAPANRVELDGAGRVVIASLDSSAPTDVFLARLAEPSFRADPFASVEPGLAAIVALPHPGDGHAWTLWVEGFGVLGTCLD